MSHYSREFIDNEIYHVTLKTIDDKLLFRDIDDFFRGIFSFYEFNDKNPVIIREKRRIRLRIKSSPVNDFIDERKKIVEVLVFTLMPNHIHLLLRQITDGGITKFMSKNGTGLGGYLNRKYPRKGPVFEDRFKSVHIKDEVQLKNVITYIHVNALSIIEPGWKENGIKYPEKALNFLFGKYRWSSLFDYIGKKNFPSVTERNFILDIMGGIEGIKKDVENWVYYNAEIRKFPEIYLE